MSVYMGCVYLIMIKLAFIYQFLLTSILNVKREPFECTMYVQEI